MYVKKNVRTKRFKSDSGSFLARVLIQKEFDVKTDEDVLDLRNTIKRYKLFDNHFVEITVPHITKATGACENIATMFDLDFFGERRYLSQTGQLYLEVLTPYLNKVFAIGPSFRAEPSVDERHLVEFTLIEIEFKGNFLQLLDHIEKILHSMIQEVVKNCTQD